LKKIIKNSRVFTDGMFKKCDVLIDGGIIAEISPSIDTEAHADGLVFDFSGRDCVCLPGLTDVHVHLREPGFTYKETIKTGTMAAARGGFTSVCAMPNLKPAPDCLENLKVQLDAIEKDAVVHVYPYGTITVGQQGKELADMEAMAPYVKGFSDDGKGIQDPEMMKKAMLEAKRLGSMIVAHCEDESLLHGGCIHEGHYAEIHGHYGISSESEWAQIARDAELLKETGCAYHVCHMSAAESVEVVRKAKAQGVDISCETGPHYIAMCDMDIREHGRFKMNPPIRGEEDRDALIAGLQDGTIDMIITDHAPHSAEEKSKGLEKSLMGVVGLETSFAACYTHLVKNGKITLEKLIDLMHGAPKRRFGIGIDLEVGQRADLTVFDLDAKYTVDPGEFLSMGKATPFEGMELYGRCLLTLVGGEMVWKEN